MGYFSDIHAEGPYRTWGEAEEARRFYPEEYRMATQPITPQTTPVFTTRAEAVSAAKASAACGWFLLIGYKSGGWQYACPGRTVRLPDLNDTQICYRRAASGRWYQN